MTQWDYTGHLQKLLQYPISKTADATSRDAEVNIFAKFSGHPLLVYELIS